MTDITELALIAKIKKQTENFDTVVLKEWEALALVEALEKAQRANGHLREQSAEWERKAISNFEECAKLSQRVEELESRAVTVENLQESAYRAGLTAGWNLGLANNNDGFNKCLAAHRAGIKVEAE
ncbi:hypothetical protein AU361_13210 [Klebsiella pneumoniae]|uniref:hypothetical protein n=1 Tax=Klebsiella pneumoniae TaxID=573 RepID=UPI0007387849|nr:hypothetical protein [Klebsiella pneumoniae]ALU54412.1 hypothetical protein AU361_13210 [Klebsiella pneumoniae]